MAGVLEAVKEKCNMCNGSMVKIDEREIGDTKYDVLKCEKCNHQIARTKD